MVLCYQTSKLTGNQVMQVKAVKVHKVITVKVSNLPLNQRQRFLPYNL